MDASPKSRQSSLLEDICREVTAQCAVQPIDAGKFHICGKAAELPAADKFLFYSWSVFQENEILSGISRDAFAPPTSEKLLQDGLSAQGLSRRELKAGHLMAVRSFRNVLCIVPPYQTNGGPPAGIAALMGYLRRAGHHDFDVLDLRLLVPDSYAPTHSPIGVFGETYVTDIPDLPLVLKILAAHDAGERGTLIGEINPLFTQYCLERGINPKYLHEFLVGTDRFIAEVLANVPDLRFIGFSTWASNYATTLIAAAHLKRRRFPPFIVAGGPQVTQSLAARQLGLQSGLFDAVVLGEGEETLLELYEEFVKGNGSPARHVPGTAILESSTGKIVEQERKLLALSSLPTPDFSRMPLALYGLPRRLPHQMSRGCSDRCTFCSEWSFWTHYRRDAVMHTVDQVEEMISRYGMQQMEFTDSLLNANLAQLTLFAEELLAREITVTWSGLMRAKMDRETARLLKRSGFTMTFVGIESMSDETLALMNKRRTEADNFKALEAILDAGIFVRAGLIPGFPGDTRDRFMKTIQAISALQSRYPRLLQLNVDPFVVNPGSPIFSDLSSHGLSSEKWADEYLELAPRYLPITSEVKCTVSGPNQGMDRMGALQVVRAVTDVQDKVEFANGLYNNEEQISAAHLTFSAIADGWYLARLKASNGQIKGLLLTRDECQSYHDLLASYNWRPHAIAEDEQFASWWASIDRKHALGIADRSLQIFRSVHCIEPDQAERLWVPTQVVARVTGSRKKQLRLVNTLTEGSVLVSADMSELVIRMSERPRSAREIAKFLEAFDLDEEKYLGSAKLMMVLGIYQVVECKKDIAAGRTERRPKRRDDQLQGTAGL